MLIWYDTFHLAQPWPYTISKLCLFTAEFEANVVNLDFRNYAEVDLHFNLK